MALRYGLQAWIALDQWSHAGTVLGGIRNWAPHVIGSPTLVSCQASLDSLARHNEPWRGETVSVESFRAWLPHPRRCAWTLYSATVALAYAAWRGATRIDVYGADMAGRADWDSVEAGSNRTDQRWQSERHIWDWLVGALKERGCEVIRHEL